MRGFQIATIVPYLIIAGVAFLIYRFVSRFLATSPLRKDIEENTNQIVSASKDMMSNGSTYLGASKYIFEHLYSNNPLGWLKSTDKVTLGNFMLSVKYDEYKQLYNTYFLYKQEVGTWILGSKKDSLSTDLKDCFSKEQQALYLSHLPL